MAKRMARRGYIQEVKRWQENAAHYHKAAVDYMERKPQDWKHLATRMQESAAVSHYNASVYMSAIRQIDHG
ncbi:hypothetical protein IB276_22545 [Ensifer sp. ENS04]|uniref:hypothetical protein n=1 Tax=Ensifer sp. ENS04 TaxID=2769281 RepID=UPI00177C3E1A|nr:hypothetical protein [Ensifer sp. ENS04]MBD9542228.1 hypothetical protein [Ensifer sp. ENS04]